MNIFDSYNCQVDRPRFSRIDTRPVILESSQHHWSSTGTLACAVFGASKPISKPYRVSIARLARTS
jgi:hypothetical protein